MICTLNSVYKNVTNEFWISESRFFSYIVPKLIISLETFWLLLSFCVAIPPFFTQTLCFSLQLIPKADLYKTSSAFLLSQQDSTEGVMTLAFCFLTGPFSVGLRDCICHEVSGSPYNELCVVCWVDCAEVHITLSTADPVSSLTCPSWETEAASFHLAPGTRMSHILPLSQD